MKNMFFNSVLVAFVLLVASCSKQPEAKVDVMSFNIRLDHVAEYSVKKLPDSDNLFHFFATSKEEMTQETLLECSREFLDELLTLVPSECVRISVVGPKAG